MAYRSNANSPLGYPTPGQLIAAASVPAGSVLPSVPIGTIAKFYEDTLLEGEYIFLPGVASTVAGDVVVYDLTPGAQSTTRLVHNAENNTGQPVAIATAATVASTWGWYQISGIAIVNVVAGTAAGVAMSTATAGQLGNTPDAGDQILNARVSTGVGTPAAGQSYVTIDRPSLQSQIT